MKYLSITLLPHWRVPPGMVTLILAAHLLAGLMLGALYFGSVWWNARQFAAGGRVLTIGGLVLGRLMLLGGVLLLASLEGALPLLLTALGVLVARPVIVRCVGSSP